MTDLERDLRIAETMASDLKDYLLSGVLYWQLSDSGPRLQPFPLGTVGGMLLRIERLNGSGNALSPDQFQRFAQARDKAEAELKHWAVQAELKEAREIKARLQTWSAFLDDASADPKRYNVEYPTQVENRTIMELLLARAGKAVDGQNFRTHLETLDARLKGLTQRADFIWDSRFAAAFPENKYWWLYVRLHS